MRLAWLTDLHLDFVTPAEVAALAQTVVAAAADGVVVTGDIATGTTVVAQLEALAAPLACPVWFVLGNHDFYGASIASVRAEARALTQRHPHLRWLPATGVIRLDAETALVGHDGWGDGRLGDLAGTRVFLSDFVYIAELAGLAQAAWAPALGALGDEAAAALAPTVAEALTWARHVVVATHVPPFRDACWHEGAISDDDWLPFFTCAAVGEVLRAAMIAHPDACMTVLCGHTHGAGVVDVLPNLRVITGGADYGAPALQALLAL